VGIETDVGSRWWWSSGHSVDIVNSDTTENLLSLSLTFLGFFLGYLPSDLVSSVDDALVVNACVVYSE